MSHDGHFQDDCEDFLRRFTTVPSLVIVSEALHPVSLTQNGPIFDNISPVQFISTNP